MILDNFSGHKLDESVLPTYLKIIYLPPNLTSRHQPADMGMISTVKTGYKAAMLDILLSIFDAEGGFERAVQAQAGMRRGTKGLSQRAKAHILDAMRILKSVWSNSEKYASREAIMRCWRKARIMPPSYEAHVNAVLGSKRYVTAFKRAHGKAREFSIEEFELVSAMKQISLASAKHYPDGLIPDVLKESFIAEKVSDEENLVKIAHAWVRCEEDPAVIEALFDEEVDALENNEDIEEAFFPDDGSKDNHTAERFDTIPKLNFETALNHLEDLRDYAVQIGLDAQYLDRPQSFPVGERRAAIQSAAVETEASVLKADAGRDAIEPQMKVDQQEHSNVMRDSEEREGSNEESGWSGIEEVDSETDISED